MEDSIKPYLHEVIRIAGGQSALARACGGKIKQAHVWNWLNRPQPIPAESVLQICAAVDWQVTPHQLRPEIYPHPDDGLPTERRLREVA